MKSLPQFIVLIFSLSLLSGCGGDDPPASTGGAASTPTTTQIQPKPVGITPTPVGGGRTPTPSKQNSAKSVERAESDLPPGVSPDDVFELSPAANMLSRYAATAHRSTPRLKSFPNHCREWIPPLLRIPTVRE